MKSKRPYLVRAVYEWIVDNKCTPYILVHAETEGVDVPDQFVQEGRIVLNVSQSAVRDFVMDNEQISFSARFAGQARSVRVPVGAILAIYAKENGQGTFFEGVEEPCEETSPPQKNATRERPARPSLRLVK